MCDIDPFKLVKISSLDKLLEMTCFAKGTTMDGVKSRNRNRDNSDTRFAYFILAKQYTIESDTNIAKIVYRSRCDVNHALKNLTEVKEIKSIIESVKSNLFLSCQ
jgi:hypothetical protein